MVKGCNLPEQLLFYCMQL